MGRQSSVIENKYQGNKMKPFRNFLTEVIIFPSTTPGTISLWHGGRLDNAYDETISHKKGRWEFGPGLYLTSHYQTAQKYAKGSRRLYLITIAKGNDAKDTSIPIDKALNWCKDYVIRSKQAEILGRLNKWVEHGEVKAYIFINVIINNDAIKNTDTAALRTFLVRQGIDYLTTDNAFGWHEKMITLFNMAKIVEKKVVNPKDKIEIFDLPTEWN
jgi:hypothetical protein